jgi:hypothetical protein
MGYKNPVRTSQETYYFSATEPSQLMLCKISGFHWVDYECSSGMLRRLAHVRTDVSVNRIASIIRLTSIGGLATTLALSSNRRTLRRNNMRVRRLLVTANVVPSSPILVTLMMEALRSSESSVLTRATRYNVPEDGILNSHRRHNLNSYWRIYVFLSKFSLLADKSPF